MTCTADLDYVVQEEASPHRASRSPSSLGSASTMALETVSSATLRRIPCMSTFSGAGCFSGLSRLRRSFLDATPARGQPHTYHPGVSFREFVREMFGTCRGVVATRSGHKSYSSTQPNPAPIARETAMTCAFTTSRAKVRLPPNNTPLEGQNSITQPKLEFLRSGR